MGLFFVLRPTLHPSAGTTCKDVYYLCLLEHGRTDGYVCLPGFEGTNVRYAVNLQNVASSEDCGLENGFVTDRETMVKHFRGMDLLQIPIENVGIVSIHWKECFPLEGDRV